MIELHNPADMPDVMQIENIEEPWIKATILTPDEYLGSVLKLCQDRRGEQKSSPMSASAPWSTTTCRSTRWCSISTTG
jgi:translation elongation factor EF-4